MSLLSRAARGRRSSVPLQFGTCDGGDLQQLRFARAVAGLERHALSDSLKITGERRGVGIWFEVALLDPTLQARFERRKYIGPDCCDVSGDGIVFDRNGDNRRRYHAAARLVGSGILPGRFTQRA